MLGFTIEKVLGKWYKYLALIILGGIGGNLVSGVIDPYNIGVGASTSLYAVLAALCVWFFRYWHLLGPMRGQYLIFTGFMILFTFLNGFLFPSSGIDSWGHLGGFIFGIFLALILVPYPES